MIEANRPLRIIFFGTPAFAVPTLEALLASPHRVVAVITQPDRPRGRGQRVTDAPLKQSATAHGLDVVQPDRLRAEGFLARLAGLAPDLGVVAAYGKILPDPVIAIPRLGLINVHASLLPKYRGAAPVHRAVIAGDRETGVCIMRIVHDLDAGAVFDCRGRAIGEDETSVDVERDLARLGADLLITVVSQLAAGTAREVPQDAAAATYAPRLTREDGAMDWRRSAQALHNLVRGLHPWPHAAAFVGSTRYLIHRTRVVAPVPAARREPGDVLEAAGDRLMVAAGEGTALQIIEIQKEGRRAMTAREFLAGHAVAPGARFTRDPVS